MRILHICFESHYTEGMGYQEHLLTNQNIKDGHEVFIITDTAKFVKGDIVEVEPEQFTQANGAIVTRLPYYCGKKIGRKIRKAKGLYEQIVMIRPDIIFHHSISAHSLVTAARFVKNNPQILLFADTHADLTNSASNFLSKNILHGLIYKHWFHKAKPYIKKVFCPSPARMQFANQIYGVPNDMMEMFLMGSTIRSEEERKRLREGIRAELSVKESNIFILHAGKLDKIKKTIELIDAFSAIKSSELRLIIVGSIADDIKTEFEKRLSADQRIHFLGWIPSEKLMEMYCAADVYVQPGRHSVNVESAICAGCAMIVSEQSNYGTVSIQNGWQIENINDIKQILDEILDHKEIILEKSQASIAFAEEYLDYAKTVEKMYH